MVEQVGETAPEGGPDVVRVGDLVRLAGGGPAMTVVDIEWHRGRAHRGWAWCVWFDGPDLHRGDFPTIVLERAREGGTDGAAGG